jgi:hypothetical protein
LYAVNRPTGSPRFRFLPENLNSLGLREAFSPKESRNELQ